MMNILAFEQKDALEQYDVNVFVRINILRFHQPTVAGKHELSRREVGGSCKRNIILAQGQRLIVDLGASLCFVELVSTQGDLLEKTASVKDHIEKGKDQYGTQTFDQHLTELYQKELITMEVAKAAATSPADFERNLQYQ